MNSLRQKIISTFAVLMLLVVVASAEPQERRWLFVFDTSSAMKKRLPAVETEIKSLLLAGTNSLFAKGDSLGIWTVGDQLQLGQFPLTTLSPERSPLLVSNLTTFLRKQRFVGTGKLEAIQPTLNRIIEDSERLTVVIFCEGTETVNWTPYDQGINNALHQAAAERKKSSQPAVLLLRTQTGKYVGATVSLPPAPVTAPPFPLLAREQKPIATNPPPVVAPVVPKIIAPSLIIVGTHVSTNKDDLTNSIVPPPRISISPTNNTPPARSNSAPGKSETVSTTTVPPVKTNSANSDSPNTAVTSSIPIIRPATTNHSSIASVTPPGDGLAKALTYSGGGLLLVAAGLVIFLLRPRRAPMNSLITSSMQENFQPPKQK